MQMPPDSEPTTQATTAVATPAESKEGSRAPSVRAGREGGVDLEKGRTGRGTSGTIYSSGDLLPGEYAVPVLGQGVKSALTKPVARATKWRVWYNPYRQLFTFCLTLNLVGILLASTDHFPYGKRHGPAITLGNIVACCAVRNEAFLRVVFYVLVKIFQKWTPLGVRIWLTAFLQHLGGIHSGCAVSAFAWLIYTTVMIFQHHKQTGASESSMAWAVITCVILGATWIAAMPWIRERHHNWFERNHRYAGWSTLGSVWIFVCIADTLNRPVNPNKSMGWNLVHSQEFWFTVGVTILIFFPWFTVRKVPVEITTPSPRVAIVKFQRGIQQGLLGRISRTATLEYHGFGIISEGIGSGCHYMIVGVQGDWTRGIVNEPPAQLYTREMKFAGLPYLAHLYRRGICICTGSGIGAVLSTCVQLDNWYLIWIGANMEETFGPVLFDMIARKIPRDRYIVFDTKKEGRRPDTVKMLKDIYDSFKAEVVIITSNPKGNKELMQACKENNMHSFGPLWDS